MTRQEKMFIERLERISNAFGNWKPGDCDNLEMSDEYIKEYTECIQGRKNLNVDAIREDARADIDGCYQCCNRHCEIVKLRTLVDEYRKYLEQKGEPNA